ncbi:hypothetical protein CEXT_200531, partial [Caerostris extrusa]
KLKPITTASKLSSTEKTECTSHRYTLNQSHLLKEKQNPIPFFLEKETTTSFKANCFFSASAVDLFASALAAALHVWNHFAGGDEMGAGSTERGGEGMAQTTEPLAFHHVTLRSMYQAVDRERNMRTETEQRIPAGMDKS